MSYRIFIAKHESFPWLFARANVHPSEKFWMLEVADDAGEIKGMVGMDLATPNMVQFHVALESPMALKLLLPAAAKIGFGANRKYAAAIVPGSNEKVIRLAKRVGFKEVQRIKDGWEDGSDLVMLLMPRTDCVWLDEAERKVA